MKILQRFMKGEIPFTTVIPVASTWTEFTPDEDDGSQDGNDEIHHSRMEHMIPASKRLEAQTDEKPQDSSDG